MSKKDDCKFTLEVATRFDIHGIFSAVREMLFFFITEKSGNFEK